MSELISVSLYDRDLRRLLVKVAGRVKNMRPAMRQVAGIMHDEVEENFEDQGRPGWEPLAASTIAAREKRGHWPGSILQESGELATSVTQKYDSDSALVGTNKRYGAIHQFGGQAGRGLKVHIPARDYLTPSPDGMHKIKSALIRYLNGR